MRTERDEGDRTGRESAVPTQHLLIFSCPVSRTRAGGRPDRKEEGMDSEKSIL